jgi:Ca2+-binding RTX toxin-like protein
MKRARLVLALVAAIALAVPSTAAALAPPGDLVVGSVGDGLLFVTLEASSGTAGQNPTGHIVAHVGGGLGPDFSLDASCLSVSGNTAIIGFSGTESDYSHTSSVAGLIKVIDGGAAGSGLDTFEWAYNEGTLGPTSCSAFPGPFTLRGGSDPQYTDITVVPLGTPTCAGRLATDVGTAGDDVIAGTPGDDVIVAGDGNDVILGLGGDDVICAGTGNDQVYAGTGDDRVLGEAGNDLLRGGAGNDELFGQAGSDQLRGMDGNDALVGGDGNDAMLGGSGADVLFGQADADALFGGPGADVLAGGDGDDVLVGGLGTNTCDGGPGTNTLIGC